MAAEEQLNRTYLASKSKSSLPADSGAELAGNSDTLFEWLGSFWSEVYSDPEFIKDMQEARALRMSQLYLDLLENIKLEDRENAPVFHRERWHPIAIRKSWRNTGSDGMFKLTSATTGEVDEHGAVPELNLGDQRSGVYKPCTVVRLGGREATFSGMTVYPLRGESAGLKSVLTCVSNDIVNATVVLGNGTGFAMLDGAIAISEDEDPFTGANADKWPKFEIEGTPDSPGDEEVVLWACDALFDRGLVYRHLGYAMRLPNRSSEIYKQVVNAAWNTVASGATPLLIRSLMASICGIPTVKTEGEVVERVHRYADGLVQVITDKNVYSFPKGSKIRKDVKAGAVLRRFDLLDKAIRVYASPTDVMRVAAYSEFLDDFDELMEDVPALDLPPAFFRSDVKNGFSVDWDLKEVWCTGFYKDKNDPDGKREFPKLRFTLGGSVSDEDKFWEDTWRRYEAAGKSMETCLDGILHDKIVKEGPVGCEISPMEFFMHNLIGANTLIITVRTDTLADDAPLYDPKFFGVVRECIPSYIRLYVVEHTAVPAEKVDTGSVRDDGELLLDENCDDFVRFRKTGSGRKKGPGGMKTRDMTSSKWVASCADYDEYDYYE